MFEVVNEALAGVASLILERRPHGGEASRILFLIAFSVIATALIFSWRTLAYRSPIVRRLLLPSERYAGRYLQALWRSGDLRYSIVRIFYNVRLRRYEVAGRTYNAAGRKLADFTSVEVQLPPAKDGAIEFVWRAGDSSKGYTKMILGNVWENYIQGDGHVITFGAWPMAYPMRFKHLQDQAVRKALGVRAPVSAAGEPEFVKKFHAAFGARVIEGFGGRKVKDQPREPEIKRAIPAQLTGPVLPIERIRALAAGEYPS